MRAWGVGECVVMEFVPHNLLEATSLSPLSLSLSVTISLSFPLSSTLARTLSLSHSPHTTLPVPPLPQLSPSLPAVGAIVAKTAADSLTPVVLELGGKVRLRPAWKCVNAPASAHIQAHQPLLVRPAGAPLARREVRRVWGGSLISRRTNPRHSCRTRSSCATTWT